MVEVRFISPDQQFYKKGAVVMDVLWMEDLVYIGLEEAKELHTKLGHLLQDLEVGDEGD